MRFLFLLLFTAQLGFAQTTEKWLKIEYKNQPADSVRVADVERLTFTEYSYYGVVTDIDGNLYHTVRIGNQEWTVENLQTTKYNDGSTITKVIDNNEWANKTSGAYCAYENNEGNVDTYGYLYNWYAVNTGKLAPSTDGWRVPTETDWVILENFINAPTTLGSNLKTTFGWYNNGNGTDDYGFKALPSGYRFSGDGTFYDLFLIGRWWSSNESGQNNGYSRLLFYDNTFLRFGSRVDVKSHGFSVRLVRDIN